MHAMASMWDENDLKNNWFTTFSTSIKSHTLVPFPPPDSAIVKRDGVAAQAVTPVKGADKSTAFLP